MPTLVPVILPSNDQTPSVVHADNEHDLFKPSCFDHMSLFQSTLHCALSLAKPEETITIAPYEHASIMCEQLADLHFVLRNHLLIEPEEHKASAAVSCAAHYASLHFSDPILWILPIHQLNYYAQTLKYAVTYSMKPAHEGALVLFGLRPFKPDTRYAYILSGDANTDYERLNAIRMYVPHPTVKTVESIWQQPYAMAHSGSFLVSAKTWLNAIPKDLSEKARLTFLHAQESYFGPIFSPGAYRTMTDQSLAKSLGLLSQRKHHALEAYPLPADTSKQNGWYQLWKQSQEQEKGLPVERFLSRIETEVA